MSSPSISAPPAPFQVTISPSESDPLDVIEGTSITLRCTVPPSTTVASISWSLMGAGLSSVTQVSNGLLLSLAPVEKNDAGIYTCGVMDTTGTNVSSSIEIAVLSKSRVHFAPISTYSRRSKVTAVFKVIPLHVPKATASVVDQP